VATLHVLAPAEDSQPGDIPRDRRAAPRFACDVGGTCKPAVLADDKRWAGRVKDVSAGGLGLLVQRRFEPGTLLRVDLSGAEPDAPQSLFVTVVHLRPLPGGQWLLGCTLGPPPGRRRT
jgi:hypothetical protein